MRRREFLAVLGGSAFAWPFGAQAQQAPAIGFISTRSLEDSGYLVDAFRKGLAEQGYNEGRNLAVEFRWAQGQYDRLPSLAAELVGRRVSLIATAGGEPTALAAKSATSDIPIVFVIGGDPVKPGLALSLNRPGGNSTGISLLTSDLESKRLGLLHELVPNGGLVAALVNPGLPNADAQTREVENAARSIGRRTQMVRASNADELNAALNSLLSAQAGGLLVAADPFFDTQKERIIAFAAQHRLPAIYQFREYALAGGLMSYGISLAEGYRHAGVYAGRILKGEKPAELPVMQSTKFELVINLKTAKALGLVMPPTLLARADEAIE
jgi:putative ABC transport system substrate-binding protein